MCIATPILYRRKGGVRTVQPGLCSVSPHIPEVVAEVAPSRDCVGQDGPEVRTNRERAREIRYGSKSEEESAKWYDRVGLRGCLQFHKYPIHL